MRLHSRFDNNIWKRMVFRGVERKESDERVQKQEQGGSCWGDVGFPAAKVVQACTWSWPISGISSSLQAATPSMGIIGLVARPAAESLDWCMAKREVRIVSRKTGGISTYCCEQSPLKQLLSP